MLSAHGQSLYLLHRLLFLIIPDLTQRSLSVRVLRENPIYQLKFEVFYNGSDSTTISSVFSEKQIIVTQPTNAQQVSNRCGEHYATTLLSNFIKLNPSLDSLCVEATVKIGIIAVVYLYIGEVRIETLVNVSLRNRNSGDRSDIITCTRILNDSLQNIEELDKKLSVFSNSNNHFDQSCRISRIGGTSECNEATMSPKRFILRQQEWICPEGFIKIHDKWECIAAESIDSTTMTITTMIRPPRRTTSSPLVYHITVSSHTDNNFQETVFPPQTSSLDFSTELGPTFKFWGVDALTNISRIHLTEGDRVFELPVRIWFNQSAICQHEVICNISLVVSFVDARISSEPMCRKTGKSIPQIVLNRPIVPWASEEEEEGANYCSFRFPPNQTIIDGGSLLMKAVIDHKYDEEQIRFLRLSLVRRTAQGSLKETLLEMPVIIEDMDRKATCQSINDPHITTFDGLEYNNYFEGEFVMYRHKTLPFSVHAIYQKCNPSLLASCNCAVAVQSGDDVIVIDRCFRRRHPVPAIRSRSSPDGSPAMSVKLFMNGNLTLGTKIYEDAGGKKYFIFLPHGTYVKVIVNAQLINVWVVPAPNDLFMTKGLCGFYDRIRTNDFTLRNGSVVDDVGELTNATSRLQPQTFIRDWRVELGTSESLFNGVPPASKIYEPGKYCICGDGSESPVCDYAIDVSHCDIYQGNDVTKWFVDRAINATELFIASKRRTTRDVHDNSIPTNYEEEAPILIDKEFVPPSKYKWKNYWNEVRAKDYCRNYIKDAYRIGQLCAQIPTVNFKQDITTCAEDIQITGNTSFANSARDAMKEQCLEEIQKNGSIPNDIVKSINDAMCINDCSGNGECINSTCHCTDDYMSADCSIAKKHRPYVNEMPKYGLCDIRYMNCDRVIVYGGNFVESDNLTCHLQQCKMTDRDVLPLNKTMTLRATFINFNAVECPIPSIHVYLIRISNNGMNTSEPLLYVPFDSVCNSCTVMNTTCLKRRNSCIIDGKCYREGERSPLDGCLVCKTYDDEYQWSTINDDSCYHVWWETFHLPDWVVALGAAFGGSLIGVATGFLLYRCCCRNNKSVDDEVAISRCQEVPENNMIYEADPILHRNDCIPTFVGGNPFSDLDLNSQTDFHEPSLFYDGRGVENGVDSTTYF